MSVDLKPCPFRVHGERTASLTVVGEFYYNEIFMPCMGEKCASFMTVGSEHRCYRDNLYLVMDMKDCGKMESKEKV